MGSYCSGLYHCERHLQCLKTVINCKVLRLKIFNSEGEFCPRSIANETDRDSINPDRSLVNEGVDCLSFFLLVPGQVVLSICVEEALTGPAGD